MSDTVKPVVQNSEQIDDLGTPLGAEEILLSKPERKKKRLDELRDFYKQRMPELREFYGEPDPQDILKEQENISSLDTTPELPVLTEEDTKEIARGIEMEEKYGDTPVGTFLRSAASSASFGLSDALGTAVFGDEFAERRREEQKRQQAVTALGAVGGIVGSAALSGGTSLAAKGVSSGVRAATNASKAVEQASLEFMKQFPNRQIAESIVGRAAAKAAGWGTEGAIYGGGTVISDLAIGNADSLAESVMANIGTGAVIGAGMGGAVGGIARAGQKALQSTKKASDSFFSRVSSGGIADTPIVKKGIDKFKEQFDPKIAAEEYSGLGVLEISQMKRINPTFSDDLLEYFNKTLKNTPTDTNKDVFLKNQIVTDVQGRRLGEIIEQLSQTEGITVNKKDMYFGAAKKLDDFIARDIDLKAPGSDGFISTVRKFQKELLENAEKGKQTLNAKDITDIRKRVDDLVKWSGENELQKDVAYQLRKIFKEEVDNIANRAGAEVGASLKQANKAYSMSKMLEESLAAKSNKSPLAIDSTLALGLFGLGIYGPVGAAVGVGFKFLKSDLKRSMIMNGQIQMAKEKVSSDIGKALGIFKRLKSTGVSASEKSSIIGKGFLPVTTTIMLNSNLTKRDNEQKRKLESPKNKQEAMDNLQDNVERLAKDADYFESKVLAKFLAMNDAAPSVAAELINVTRRSVDFLNSKLPPRYNANTLLPQKRFLSDSEMSKMARYLQTIENPLSVLQELNKGTLTRDHVEALKVVYPSIYNEIRMDAMDMVRADPDMNYQAKLQLGILLDLNTDVSLTPENIMNLQTIYSKQPNQNESDRGGLPGAQMSGAVKPTVGALNRLGQSGRAETEAQRIAKS
jgi:hypothetical protein